TIALDLGYENVSAFIDMFRRALGTTPGKYGELARLEASKERTSS
ncbi:helix-turn-helix domain-containing protein, partial [Burkholderia multivorans]|nr:helix-turn-helix domain-containing protein [Burkholderia multivorans]